MINATAMNVELFGYWMLMAEHSMCQPETDAPGRLPFHLPFLSWEKISTAKNRWRYVASTIPDPGTSLEIFYVQLQNGHTDEFSCVKIDAVLQPIDKAGCFNFGSRLFVAECDRSPCTRYPG